MVLLTLAGGSRLRAAVCPAERLTLAQVPEYQRVDEAPARAAHLGAWLRGDHRGRAERPRQPHGARPPSRRTYSSKLTPAAVASRASSARIRGTSAMIFRQQSSHTTSTASSSAGENRSRASAAASSS